MTGAERGQPPSARLDWGVGPFSVSAERRALHAAILENPEERALYAEYSRVAIAEGDPRGEYVRLGLLREQLGADAHSAIDAALQGLRARYGRSIYAEWFPHRYAGWLGSIARDAAHHERFGFVTRVAASVEDVPGLRALLPLSTVEVLRENARAMPLPAGADFRFLRGRKRIGVREIVRRVPEVRTLYFDNEELSAADAEMLGELPQLESLSFAYRSPVALEEVLARSDTFPRLTELSFWERTVDLQRIGEIACARALKRLVVEVPSDPATLLSSLSGSAIESLTLFGFGPDLYAPLDMRAFRDAWLPHLRTLWLGEYTLEHIDALADAPVLQQLSTLELSGIANGDVVLRGLSTALRTSRIRRLTERNCLAATPAYAELAEARAFESLESLHLSDSGGDAALRTLLASMPVLARLDVDRRIEPELIDTALRMPALREFHAYFASDPDRAIAALVTEKSGEPLRSVNLPDLSLASTASLQRLADAPSLVELGSIALCTHRNTLEPRALTLLQRRFGHRLVPALSARRSYVSDLEYGALPEPDLDPWWRA